MAGQYKYKYLVRAKMYMREIVFVTLIDVFIDEQQYSVVLTG